MAKNVFDLLKKEHQEIRQLCAQVEKDPRKFQEFATELNKHVDAEERVLYQPLKAEKTLHDQVLEGYEEHHVIAMIMRELERNNPSKDVWHAKFQVMNENLEHHLKEEEESLFPDAQKVIGEDRAVEMAKEYSSAERELARA
ncbi:MAG: hemerythrin domain-containing protein [Coriobacteriia bacterium]